VGDQVRLVTPENARLHGTGARVVKLADWGAHLDAPAAATGKYRAAWSEMESVPQEVGRVGPLEYVSDECCNTCGSDRMIQAGACKVCANCGTSGGCG
jgi:hypothetical protein